MKRAALTIGLILLMLAMAACGGGDDDNNIGEDAGPLTLGLTWASPAAGASPFRATLTANISGGEPPFYYAWDFQNDGSYDRYLNDEYRRTLSVINDFMWRRTTSFTTDADTQWFNADGSDAGTLNLAQGDRIRATLRPGEDSGWVADSVMLLPEEPAGTTSSTSATVEGTITAVDGSTYTYEGDSPFQCVLRVTDSTGEEVMSDPVVVTVLNSSGFYIDNSAANTGIRSDHEDDDGNDIFPSGEPVYFYATPRNGVEPYEYFWDFDNDGSVDSTVAGQSQYTFTYQGDGIRMYTVTLTVVDATGQSTVHEFFVPVQGEGDDGEPQPDEFNIRIESTPEVTRFDDSDLYGEIEIQFDPTGESPVPVEPELDLSVVVVPGNTGGTPPFEYYWDFENDGAYDSQVLSPTLPYYDTQRRIFINPYMHQVDEKHFTLRVLVIDSEGLVQSEKVRIVARNIANRDQSPFSAAIQYGVGGTGNAPFAQVTDPEAQTDVMFQVEITGNVDRQYEYLFDAQGDGIYNAPEQLPETDGPDWGDAAGNRVDITHTYDGANYYPATITIREVDSAGNEYDRATYHVPVSLVSRLPITVTEGTLTKRTDHSMIGTYTTSASGPNGAYVSQRQFIIAGGAVGTTPLNKVERVVQTFGEPLEEGSHEQLLGTVVTERATLNQERRGAAMWVDDPAAGTGGTIRIHGGSNVLNGYLASNELSSSGAAPAPWTVLNELNLEKYYPLKDAAFTQSTAGPVLVGGLHKHSVGANAQVSGRIIVYSVMFDSYGTLTNMPTPRYDACSVFVNNRIYIIGGREANGQSVATVESYYIDPDTGIGSWDTFAPSMNYERSGATAQLINHVVPTDDDGTMVVPCVYILGGAYYPDNESSKTLLSTAEVFNPLTGVWSNTLPLPTNARADQLQSAAVVGPGGVNSGNTTVNSIVTFGGDTGIAGTGEINTMTEFTYFHVVRAPEPVV